MEALSFCVNFQMLFLERKKNLALSWDSQVYKSEKAQKPARFFIDCYLDDVERRSLIMTTCQHSQYHSIYHLDSFFRERGKKILTRSNLIHSFSSSVLAEMSFAMKANIFQNQPIWHSTRLATVYFLFLFTKTWSRYALRACKNKALFAIFWWISLPKNWRSFLENKKSMKSLLFRESHSFYSLIVLVFAGEFAFWREKNFPLFHFHKSQNLLLFCLSEQKMKCFSLHKTKKKSTFKRKAKIKRPLSSV